VVDSTADYNGKRTDAKQSYLAISLYFVFFQDPLHVHPLRVQLTAGPSEGG